MSDLVGIPKDRFSRFAAQKVKIKCIYISKKNKYLPYNINMINIGLYEPHHEKACFSICEKIQISHVAD